MSAFPIVDERNVETYLLLNALLKNLHDRVGVGSASGRSRTTLLLRSAVLLLLLLRGSILLLLLRRLTVLTLSLSLRSCGSETSQVRRFFVSVILSLR